MLQLAQAMCRLGTESAFEVLARTKALEAKGRSVINLGIGQPDFLTPSHIVEAAVKALRDGHHGYTPANGIPQLRVGVDLVVSRDPPAAGGKVDPLVNIAPLPSGGTLSVMAVRARTGVGWAAPKSVAFTSQ